MTNETNDPVTSGIVRHNIVTHDLVTHDLGANRPPRRLSGAAAQVARYIGLAACFALLGRALEAVPLYIGMFDQPGLARGLLEGSITLSAAACLLVLLLIGARAERDPADPRVRASRPRP